MKKQKVYIVLQEGPEWCNILGVFVGGSDPKGRANELKRNLEQGLFLDRIPPSYRSEIYKTLSHYTIEVRDQE